MMKFWYFRVNFLQNSIQKSVIRFIHSLEIKPSQNFNIFEKIYQKKALALKRVKKVIEYLTQSVLPEQQRVDEILPTKIVNGFGKRQKYMFEKFISVRLKETMGLWY